jgi:hypothetical protein
MQPGTRIMASNSPDAGARLATSSREIRRTVRTTCRPSEIAHIPGLDAAKIALFLRDPHPKMPDMQLSTQEAADLAAYIVSLGK